MSEVRGLLGLAGYYRRFIPNFSTVSFAMTRLTQKNRRFVWDESCQKSFEKLKQLLVSSPILVYPTLKGQFILDTDASLFGIGAVLSQVQNGEERVIAYASRTFNRSQRRYCTTLRELLSVITFVQHFRHFLWEPKFLIRTDHASLVWLKSFKNPEGIVARSISILDTYDYKIEHKGGSQHLNADSLSRRPFIKACSRKECSECHPELETSSKSKIMFKSCQLNSESGH